MSQEAVGRRYAVAIFEIGVETKTAPALAREMTAFVEVFEGSVELREVLTNPLVPEANREAVLVDVAKRVGVSDTGQKALRIVMENRRLAALPFVARHLARLVDEAERVERAFVTSATALSEGAVAKLKAELEKATGKKIVMTCTVDPALLGGVVTQIGDRVVDGSLRARLKSFRESIDPQAALAEA